MKAKEALRVKYHSTLPSIQGVGEVVRWVGDGVGETSGTFRWMFTDIATWQRKVNPGESYIMVETAIEETRFPTWGAARDYLTAEDNFQAKRYYEAAVDISLMDDDDDEDE
jgi:hypothetical protein